MGSSAHKDVKNVEVWYQNHRGSVVNREDEDAGDTQPGGNWQYMWAKENQETVKEVQEEHELESNNIGHWRRAVSIAAKRLPEHEQKYWKGLFEAAQKVPPSREMQEKCDDAFLF